MSHILNNIILGLVQGITEFLPISSSGHLVIFNHFLNVKMPGQFLELLLHAGTLLSILVVFWKKIIQIIYSFFTWNKDENFNMALMIIVGSIPTALIGLVFKSFFSSLFTIYFVSFSLFVNGLIVSSAAFIKPGDKKIGFLKSIILGIAQALAIIPGISRSGSTILSAMLMKIPPMKAFEFSFMLSIPAIAGASLLEYLEVSKEIVFDTGLILGFIASFLSGLFALMALRKTVQKGKFHYFGIYCIIISVLLIIFRGKL
ncbi:MAG: undecaprenyl-diphosphate phosphatase [Candidatus Muiribacteriota bacterium]